MRKFRLFIFLISLFGICSSIDASVLYGIRIQGLTPTVMGFDLATGELVGEFITDWLSTEDIAFGPDGYLYGTRIEPSGNTAGARFLGYDVQTGVLVRDFFPDPLLGAQTPFAFGMASVPVPEPSTHLLMLIGTIVLLVWKDRFYF